MGDLKIRNWQADPKIYMVIYDHIKSQNNFEEAKLDSLWVRKNKKVRELIITDFKIYCETTIIKILMGMKIDI